MKQSRIFGKNTSGTDSDLRLDTSNNLKVDLGTQIAGEDVTNDVLKVEQRNSYENVQGTETVKSSAGLLHLIQINQPGTNWEIEVYDGATTSAGTRIASLKSVTAGNTYNFDVAFNTGLIVETISGTTAGDLTVAYR